MNRLFRALAAIAAALWATTAPAGPGHDHGDGPAPATGQASPRFEAQSDLFELVGIADGDTLTLYLDRFETNEPVTGATVEIELLAAGTAPVTAVATTQPDGTYSFKSDVLRRAGDYALQISVTAGPDIDILAGNLSIPAPAADPRIDAGISGAALLGGAGAMVLLVLLAVAALRRRSQVAGVRA